MTYIKPAELLSIPHCSSISSVCGTCKSVSRTQKLNKTVHRQQLTVNTCSKLLISTIFMDLVDYRRIKNLKYIEYKVQSVSFSGIYIV